MSRRKISDKSNSYHPTRAWILSGLLALALAILLGNQAYAQAQQASDSMSIKKIAINAISASIHVMVVPHTLTSYATTTSSVHTLAAAQVDLAVAQTQAHTLFNSVYDATCAPCQSEANKAYQALQGEGKGTFRALAWGIRDIGWLQLLINGQTASVTLSATLWSKVQYVDEFKKINTIMPTGGEVMIYNLTKTGTNWLITNQVPDDTATSNLSVNKQKPNGKTGAPPANEPKSIKQDQKVKK